MLKIIQAANEIDISNLSGSESPIEEGEIVIGELSADLKKLYALMDLKTIKLQEFKKTLDQKILNHEKSHEDPNCPDEDCEEFMNSIVADIESLQSEHKSVRAFFWSAVKFEFNRWSDNLGIRNGFQVVTIPEEEFSLSSVLVGLEMLSSLMD